MKNYTRSSVVPTQEVRLQALRILRDRQRQKKFSEIIQSWVTEPLLMASVAGLNLDPWQEQLLDSRDDLLLCNVHRQGGKSLGAALCIIHEILEPNRTVVIMSPSERQSKLLFRTVLKVWRLLGKPVKYESVQRTFLELNNGSQVYALPANPDTIRGISSVNLLVVDEASIVDNEVFNSIAPMLAVSKGRTICLFTPSGKRPEHWLYDLWMNDPTAVRIQVPATECKRIDPKWLQRERGRVGDFWYLQEYENVFNDAVTRVFKEEHIRAAFDENLEYDHELFGMAG